MKKFGSILLTFAVLLTLCAGVLPVYAEEASITLTPYRTILTVGQSVSLTITTSSVTNVTVTVTDNYADYDVLEYDSTYNMITGLHKGTATVTAAGTDSITNETVTASVMIKIYDSTGLLNNVDYYLMNYHTGKQLALSTASDANSVSLCGRDRDDSALAQWTVISNSDGTTRLQSVFSSTGRSAYVSGTNLVLYNSTGARTKLNLYRVESGIYKGKYQILYDGKYLYMNNSGTVAFTTTQTATSYWTLMAVEKGYADIYSHQYTGYDTTANNKEFHDILLALGYLPVESVNETAEYAYEYLPDDQIFVFRGHANAGLIAFRDSNGDLTGRFYADTAMPYSNGYFICNSLTDTDKSYLSDNALANLRCALLLGCQTGVDYQWRTQTYNLVNAYFEKGAHFVVGTSMNVDADNSDDFLKGFLDKLSSGSYNLYACVQAGIISAGTNTEYVTNSNPNGQYPVVTVGDSSQYLD